MKKILFVFILMLFAGCNKVDKNQEVMLEYAKTYYSNHMIMTNTSKVFITKSMLVEAADEDGYDMSKLNTCTNDSKIIFTIDDKEIVNVEYNLECE